MKIYAIILALSATPALADISLGAGDSIILGGQRVSCGGQVSTPSAPQTKVLEFTSNPVSLEACGRAVQAVQNARLVGINGYGSDDPAVKTSTDHLDATCNYIGSQAQIMIRLTQTTLQYAGGNVNELRFEANTMYPQRGSLPQKEWERNDRECEATGRFLASGFRPSQNVGALQANCNTTVRTYPYFWFDFTDL